MASSVKALRHERTGPFRMGFLLLAVAAGLVFGADTIAALFSNYLPLDLASERAVQGVSWGPLIPAFRAFDWLEGLKQTALSLVGILLVLILNRRGVLLMIFGALSAAIYTVVQAEVHRPRPDASLVHVVRHTSNYSYPSGHVVFFTWFLALLIICLAYRYLPRPAVMGLWVLAALILLTVAVGRVYDAEHWPSDDLGGFSLGVAWTALGLSIRRLSDPVLEARKGRPGIRHVQAP